MLGRVGLYIDAICYINRPDSKRPQALKSRVATREAEWLSALPTVREAEWLSAQPVMSMASPKEKKR